ncbi:alpha/beta hydrolase [Janthinobacterium sp. ROICE36]|uniref:alpha/beta fold hydrolase n=1 Tax=Janthinobacterium sp. ROICE36 TaxID=2048670 RepID=UPI000C7F0243|nr:alpha/beta hydrolase [Janthinobacterium sp. ROICE36]PLY39492.1 alpha/beta hydrolase [Janthinobacterium sp. ROICE36]
MSKPLSILSVSFLVYLGAAIPSLAAPPAPVIEPINGRWLESLTLRHPSSSDVVVLESGSRSTIDKWGTVPEQLGLDASVFVYNRPGYGNSETTATPRDGRTIVEELRAVLRLKDLKPPYVLVGHSLGGLYMQLFARTYPDEVKALVLVDSIYPRMIKKTQDFPLLTRIAGQIAFSRTVWREIEKIDDTSDMLDGLANIDDKPIVRLINQPASNTAIAVDFGAFRMDEATRENVKALYPNAKKIVVDSSHQMALTSPEIVTATIRQVLSASIEKSQVKR